MARNPAVPGDHFALCFSGRKGAHNGVRGLFEQVYEVVEQIPEGMVATYGQVALLAGCPRSARYVGYALHSNPRPGQIPCHRVVFADGRICEGFAFGGPTLNASSYWGRAWRLPIPCTSTWLPAVGRPGSSGSFASKPPQRYLSPLWWF